MKKIETLVEDIYTLLSEGLTEEGIESKREVIDQFGKNFAELLASRLVRNDDGPTLRMSSIGKPCARQLYYEQHNSVEREELTPNTYMKFLFGDVIEELVLFLAALSGHKVEGMQDEMELQGIKGHRDAVIDGHLVDVKSASTFSFKKFKEGLTPEQDAFGYLGQLSAYLKSSEGDDKVEDKETASFLAVDKQHGHITLDTHRLNTDAVDNLFRLRKALMQEETPPPRHFYPVADGKSGNEKLGVNCSYCGHKHVCYPDLRTFIYSNGPKFLTKVVREPNVLETTEKP